jgi:hypothetical protein
MTRRRISAPTAPNVPRAIGVQTLDGTPFAIAGERVATAAESWLVEDRWWTEQPLRRRYWELTTVRARNIVVFHDMVADRWFAQAA